MQEVGLDFDARAVGQELFALGHLGLVVQIDILQRAALDFNALAFGHNRVGKEGVQLVLRGGGDGGLEREKCEGGGKEDAPRGGSSRHGKGKGEDGWFKV